MLDLLYPRALDGVHRGHRLAPWLLGVITVPRAVMGGNSILNGRFVAGTADAIPLDAYGSEGAQTILSLFATIGLGQVVLGLVAVLALARYRAAIPLVFLLFLAEHLARRAILTAIPIARTGAGGLLVRGPDAPRAHRRRAGPVALAPGRAGPLEPRQGPWTRRP